MEDNINMPENNENKVEEVKNTTPLVNNSEEVKIVTPPANNSSETKNTIPLNKKLEENPVTPLENEKDILNQKAESAKHSKATKISIAAAVTAVVATGAVVSTLVLTADKSNKVTYILNNTEVEIQIDKKNTLASIQKPSIDGYDFEGWYADENLTVKLEEDFKFTEDTTIYPKFVPKNCQVEYYANDGTGEVFFQEVVFDGEYKLIRNEFVRENYVFVGWSEDKDAHYTDENIISPNKSATLVTEGFKYYAIWKGETKKITFNTPELLVNGETYTFEKTSCLYGETFTLPAIDGEISNTNDKLTKFAGYLINDEVFNVGDEITITENTIIKINWEERDSILYFNLNLPAGEITDSIVPLSFTTAQETYVFQHLPTPGELVNYEFVCWNTEIDGSGTDYSVTDSFETTEQSNYLYAIWVGKVRTVNVYNKGEIITTIDTRFGETIELPELNLENYNFIGFNNKPDYTGKIYKGNIVVDFTDSIINLYAEYERKQITVSFNANGGTGLINKFQVNTNETYTFKADEIETQRATIKRKNYILVGWSTNPDLEPDKATFKIEVQEANIVLYAIWLGEERTVNLYSQGEIIDTINTRFGETIELPVLTLENYNFVGFNEKSDFTGSKYKGNIFVGFTDETTNLYAEYKRKQVSVSFNANSGTGTLSRIQLNTNEAYTFTEEEIAAQKLAVTKENYVLAGWSTNKNLNPSEASFTVEIQEANILLYAIWIGEERTINVYSQGEIVETINTRFGETIELPTLTLENYNFIGFNDKDDFTGSEYTGNLLVNFEDDVLNLYAKFERKQVAISFESNGGVGSIDTIMLNTNEPYTFNAEEIEAQKTALTKENYILAGWNTDPNMDPEAATFTVEIQEDALVLYAIWIGEERTVNVYSQGEIVETINTRFGETIELPELTLENHTFIGFNDKDDFTGNDYTGSITINFTDETTNLYAEFERNQITVSFDTNYGDGILNSIQLNTNETYTFTEEEIAAQRLAVTKENYVLVGWSTNPNLNPEDASFTVNIQEENVALYAIWIGEVRIVNIYSQGEIVETINTRFGETIELPTLTLENHTFIGFNDKDDFSGDEYTGSITVNFTDETTNLYANFERNQITVSFDTNGGNNSIDTIMLNTNEAYTFTEEEIAAQRLALTKENYILVGWNTNPNLNPEDASFTVNIQEENVTLYAIWIGEVRIVNIYSQGEIVSTIHTRFGEIVELPDIALENYTFIGFNDKDDFTGNEYSGNITIDFTDETTNLYANLERNQITVTFDANGGSGSINTVMLNTNEAYTFSESEIESQKVSLIKQYHTLVGWSTNPDLNPEDANFTVQIAEGNVTLYAIWKRNVSIVSFVADGGSVPADISINQGETLTLTETGFEKEGFLIKNFVYNGQEYNIGDTILIEEENVSIEVVWKEKPIIFNIEGIETVTTTTGDKVAITSLKNGDVFYAPNAPASKNYYDEDGVRYYFAGWSTNPDATTPNIYIGETTITATDSTQNLYGVYMPASEGLLYELNSSTDTYSVSYDEDLYKTYSLLIIPNTYNGKKVDNVYGFAYNGNIGRVVIAEGITKIESYAFCTSENLKSAVIPSTVTNITGVFAGCGELVGVTLSEGLTSIGENTFNCCTSLTNITIPEGVTRIDYSAFEYCSKLTNINIPESVTSIGSDAFYCCSSLTSINIPKGVTSIGSDAFYCCSSLTSINIPKGVTSIGNYAFQDCSSLTSVIIPEGVTSIGEYAFSYCSSLTSITIPSTVTNIDPYAFSDCSSLTNIVIPEGVTTISDSAFAYCSSLTSITLPEGIKYIGFETFGYCKNLTNIVLPSSVTGIDMGAFNGCTNLTSITLPSALTSIGPHAFLNCSKLASITIPEGVTEIPEYAFQNCTSLRNVTIPSTLTYISNTAFEGCSDLNITFAEGRTSISSDMLLDCSSVTSISLPSTLKTIGDSAFAGCYNLNNITIPNGVTSIGNSAFSGCESLTNIIIPDSVINIGASAFSDCESLTNINIPENVTTIGSETFFNCSSLTSITIPEGVTSIGDYAFGYCSSLTSITIPSTVTNIDPYAFSDCSSLTNIVIPEGVTTISDSAFAYCSSLTSITLPSTVKSIGYYAFNYCENLTSINIPEGVTYINEGTFESCKNLTNVTIPSTVTNIDPYAFSGCSSLTNIVIPEGVTSIGYDTFSGCESLTTVTLPSTIKSINENAFGDCKNLTSINIPEGVNTIAYYAFRGCSSLTNINLPSTLTSIGEYAFSDCSSLTGNITIPEGVDYLPMYAFAGCSNLTNITLPSTLREIDDSAFKGCTNLTSITIPKNVSYIAYNAFVGCANLESIIVDSENGIYDSRDNCNAIIETDTDTLIVGCKNTVIPSTITSIGVNAFNDCAGLKSIIIPKNITSISSGAFRGCINLESIIVDDENDVYDSRDNCNAIIKTETNTLIASNKNATIPSTATSIGSYAFYGYTNLTSIVIPEGITSIGSYAFYNCTGLTSITLPSTLTSIGTYAFSGCTGLTNITIPGNVTSIGSYAFRNCSNLMNITVSEGITTIGNYAFYGCSGLTTITLPSTLTSIGSNAFYGCTGLTNITIPEGVTSIGAYILDNCTNLSNVTLPSTLKTIGNYAFRSCTSLTSITIPNSVTSMGSYMFSNCKNLKNITISEGVKTIGNYAFYGCSGLESITLPSTLTSIGTYAFYNCSSLTSITIPNSVTSVGSYAFYGCSKLSSVTLPSSLKTIGSHAFRNCTSLTSITIPAKVTSIGTYAFYGCSKLQSMTFMGTTPPTLASSYSIPSTISKIYVPSSSLSSYRSKFSGEVTSSKIVAST